jgi:uncharacterized protein (TIGR01777 family)
MPLKIVISGTNGAIGKTLVRALKSGGHKVTPLVRSEGNEYVDGAAWNPKKEYIDREAIEEHDAVIHLAGKNLGDQRWDEPFKKECYDSRILGTRTIAQALNKLSSPPKVFLSASAVGFYGDQGDSELTEDSSGGKGYVADLCRDWENESKVAEQKGIRVAQMRIGVVLSDDGAMSKMLKPFRRGMGGVLGSGKQYMPWISLDDIVSSIMFLLNADGVSGPVNLVSPNAVTNREFTKTLGKVLSRPTFMPAPGFLLKMMFGEMAQEVLLASARVKPAKLQSAGFQFSFPDLEPVLQRIAG